MAEYHGVKLLLTLIGRQARRHPWEYALLFSTVTCVAALWVAEPLYSRYAIDTMLTMREGADVNLIAIFGWWGLLFLLLSIAQTAEKFATWRMMNKTELDRSEEVYRHVLDLDIAFHTQQKSGEVVKVIDEGAENLTELQRNLIVDFLPSLASAVVFLGIGFSIQPFLSGMLVGLILLYIAIVVIGTQKTMKIQQQANRAWVERIGRAYDAVTNIFAVKSGAQEGRELRTLERANAKVFRKQMQVNRHWAAIEAINIFMLTRILLTSVGVYFYVRGTLSLGELYFFQASFFRVLTPFEILSGILPFWNKKVGKVRLSEELLRIPVRVRSKRGAKRPGHVDGHIEFRGVCFSYEEKFKILDTDETEKVADRIVETVHPLHEPEDETQHTQETIHPALALQEERRPPKRYDHGRDVLHDVSIDIRPGEHVAFVGHSGAGKSTLAMLLNRFYDVTEGRILIDGTDLRELDLLWWRAQVGLVLQDNLMFNDTILENIRYARPDATEADVKEAAGRAAAADFIESLPKGYATLVGDRGIKLSGGQRQRVAIARAILKRPTVVVLDEATSALDSVTERRVQEGIRSLIAGHTACIIAHRLSTVRSVDRIAVLDKGRLIAFARHEELLRTCAIYKEMVELQSHGMLAE
ncbi:MAG: ABC transporter [Candidatus Peregrinibacteria bacterium Greene0416_19]|nr:MAG: ABC transporter [Candidatus Peregrinibacteria bacterium Greene0416_19]